MVNDHILQRGAAFQERGAALRNSSRLPWLQTALVSLARATQYYSQYLQAKCPQVILVSHEKELEGFADHVYRVQKSDGVSVLTPS
jgi:hypothetical protein